MNIQLKRVYDKAEKSDGTRILVDRLWPRGISKNEAKIDLWLKEIAPSTVLRKWFNHEEEKWPEFKLRYLQELKNNKDVVEQLLDIVHQEKVTIVYSAKDKDHNQAIVIKEFLKNR